MYSDHCAIKLEINNKLQENLQHLEINTRLVDNSWVKDNLKEISKLMELNENDSIRNRNLGT